MKARIEEVLSRILSKKHGAKIRIVFEEREDEQGRGNSRINVAGTNARKGN